MFNLKGTRCYIDGVKHRVLLDCGDNVLVQPVAYDGGAAVDERWVSRKTVDPHFREKDIERSAPPPLSRASEHYFWLGAEALAEMG